MWIIDVGFWLCVGARFMVHRGSFHRSGAGGRGRWRGLGPSSKTGQPPASEEEEKTVIHWLTVENCNRHAWRETAEKANGSSEKKPTAADTCRLLGCCQKGRKAESCSVSSVSDLKENQSCLFKLGSGTVSTTKRLISWFSLACHSKLYPYLAH